MDELRKGWGALLAATVGTMCGLLTITNYTQGFFVGPVTSEFGWSVAEFFFAFTITSCLGLITAPVVGTLALKYGIKRLGILGLIGHAIGYVLLSMNTGSLIWWYLTSAALAILAAGSLPIIWTSVLNGWFIKNRGKAIGITMAGTGMGAFLLPPIAEFLISNYGWRTAYQGIGIGALVLSLPVALLLFSENPDFLSSDEKSSSSNANWGMTRSEALRDYRFWLLGSVLFITIFVMVGLISNFQRIMEARGLARADIASIAALMGLTIVFGRLLVGVLVDRFWAPAVASVFFVLPIIAMLLMLYGAPTIALGMVIGIAIGLAAGAELDMLVYLTGRYFGPAHYPAVFGGIFAFSSIGAGIAPPLFGAGAQAWQGYELVLSGAIGLLLLSIVMFLMLGKYPNTQPPTETAQD
ncbi:MAG: MFS transporter [Gammaproteobacteria bacterium]|jgi:MFS transporter, OFA family, oxalate/formate antiporter|nr:MFS transporter [Gammaproteobacteria bacterium]MBT6893550.1 MFS transporter [Gammaproteobacteria bacterium]